MKHKSWCQSTGEIAVLTAIADHMGKDLRSSYASQTTLADETFMSTRSVGTHMRSLAKRGVIVPGDPAVVEHIRGDRRPPVWNFPADLPRRPSTGGKPFQSSQGSTDRQRVEGDATRDSARQPATGGNEQQPRVETVADEPVTTEPGTSVGGDGRRPSTGSEGRSDGGRAASGKEAAAEEGARGYYQSHQQRLSTSELRAVLERLPRALAAQLENEWSRGLPASVIEAIGLGLEDRTVEQIVARVERRWLQWSYENDAVAESGVGLARPLGVLLTLLGPSTCWGNNARCEDGADIDTDVVCPRCEEARADKAAARRDQDAPPAAGYSVPFQRPANAEPSPYVQCTGAGCGVKMMPTEDGMCRECRAEGAVAPQPDSSG
ncbi:hypothetical protein [Streptomyces sp. H27-C3]|uniref:hypothetical protein n=1 Tax=Streptomyces sp. H27-C3 TaxID=3046305 RepID=UPI0024B9D5B5|nr:hypothetical protein [Streptomyces sp. H27-C3]MDJ0465039.1 hypothetical protein [Streptomyces sp. H27-C3]